jgi:low temperature requirement protein LtrA
MNTAGSARTATEGGDLPERRVTPLELFFDLVFVFALTQVTGFLADHLSWTGMLEGAALLVVLWWAWAGYVWLTNAVPAEEVIPARLVILIAMGAMLVASLAVPDAFGEYGVLFGLSYFVVRLLHVVLFVLATGGTPETNQAMLRLAPGFLGAPLLLIPAGFADGFVQGALWAVAIGIDLSVSLVRGVSGFRVHAGHFVERFGLIIIIALGESIVAIGVGASGLALGPGVVLASVLGVALAAALWWAYFDLVMLVAERRLFAAKGAGEACAGRLPLPAPADGGRDHLRRPGHQANPGPCRGSTRNHPGRGAVRRGRPLPSRAQRLQAARGRQRERSQVGGDGSLLRANPRSSVDPLSGHPRGANVCAGRFRDDAISGVPA